MTNMNRHETSLWWNPGEYPDEILSDTLNEMIIKYYGQHSGKMDKYVGVGNYFFLKTGIQNWTYIGIVSNCNQIGIDYITKDGKTKAVNIFRLVILKSQEIHFRIKNNTCGYFGWNHFNPYSGIIRHTQVL
jgi:hypothetical protein